MEGRPGEGPEAMDVTLICPAIWPMLLMLLVAMLVAMETLLRFMPLPLYMLLLFCWVNWGDACCCENILGKGEGEEPFVIHSLNFPIWQTWSKTKGQKKVCFPLSFWATYAPDALWWTGYSNLQPCYLFPPMLPCGQPFMSGEPWKAAFPWPCCIIGDWVWAMRGESRGLCGVPGPPKPPSACWLIPVVDASEQVNQTEPAETKLQTNLLSGGV